MPVDPRVIDQLIRFSGSRDVRDSPVVTAIILRDPSSAADIVPYLDQAGGNPPISMNARRIMCLFDGAAVPHLVRALRHAGPVARKAGIEILWSMMTGESARNVRKILAESARDLEVLLDDKRPLPENVPAHIERIYRRRICDLAFIVLKQLVDPGYDPGAFESRGDKECDEEITRLKSAGFGLGVA